MTANARPVMPIGRPTGSADRRGAATRVDPRFRKPTPWRPFCAEVGRRIEQLMRERDIAASELAAALHRQPSTVFQWLRGDHLPTLLTLAQIALALRCTVVDLLPESAHHVPRPSRTA